MPQFDHAPAPPAPVDTRTPAIQRTVVDGVPVFWAEAPAPFTAALVFRVGRADETLGTSGVTHLVEHLALFPIGRTRFESNGFVDDTHTTFYASGAVDEVVGFIHAVTRTLAGLPLHRLELEKRVLMTESANAGGSGYARLLALRFGAQSFGLAQFDELGLQRLSAEEVAAWAAERFVAGNAALWLTGPPPDSLRLELPSGRRHAPPRAEPLPHVRLPAHLAEGSGSVGISALGERSIALTIALSIATERAHDRLRLAGGLSYSISANYVPLNAERAHVVVGADCLPEHAQPVLDGMLDVLAELANAGPTQEELDDLRARRRTDDESEVRGRLDYAAREELLGGTAVSREELDAELDALTPEDVRDAVAATLGNLIVLAPERTQPRRGFAAWGSWPAESVDGSRYRPRVLGGASLYLADEGISLAGRDEYDTVTIRFDDCAALLRWTAGRVTLIGKDGSWIEIKPQTFRKGDELVAAVTQRVADDVVIPMEALEERSLAEVAEEKLAEPRDVADELRVLAEQLQPGERVENLAAVTRALKPGLLALTDRRLLHVTLGFTGGRTEVREFPFASIDAVKGRTRLYPRLLGRLTIVADGKRISFGACKPQARAVELWQALRERSAHVTP
jgi:predicted Zn-dependent peptidase